MTFKEKLMLILLEGLLIYREMALVNVDVNSLSVNPTKWSNTLKQFVGFCRRIVRVCLTILWGWRLTLIWLGFLGVRFEVGVG